MRILVIGCNGQLGRDMILTCRMAGIETIGADLPEINITDEKNTLRFVSDIHPDCIVNCCAYTAVDEAEQNPKLAFDVNAAGVANCARAAVNCGASMVHFSSDYVFSGESSIPYVETDPTNPKSVYGKSKLEGDRLLSQICPDHFIFRIAWLYSFLENNFVKAIRKIARQKNLSKSPLTVVNDQFGTPTWSADVCRQVLALIPTKAFGLYHATSEGQCSWYDFAREIISASGINVDIEPCSSAQFLRPAPRPAFSVLENKALKQRGLNMMPHWQESFKEFLRLEALAGQL